LAAILAERVALFLSPAQLSESERQEGSHCERARGGSKRAIYLSLAPNPPDTLFLRNVGCH